MAKIDKLLELAQPHLEPHESVLAAVQGTYETKILGSDTTRAGILIATANRIVFFAKKLGGYDLESFGYRNISSFEQGKNMMGHHISFYASGNKVQVKWIADLAAMQEFVRVAKQQLNDGRSSETPPPPAAVAAPVSSSGAPASNDHDAIIDAIRKLGDLRTAGILDESEFAAKKAELLARL